MEHPNKVAPSNVPTAWQRVLDTYALKYQRATGKAFEKPFVALMNGLPFSTVERDTVAEGFARKTVTALLHTCQQCGRSGRRRRHTRRYTVMCAACFSARALRADIAALLDDDAPTEAGFRPEVAWHEHELPPRIRGVIPSQIWRQTDIPGVGPVRYLGKADVQALAVWLTKLACLVDEETATAGSEAKVGAG